MSAAESFAPEARAFLRDLPTRDKAWFDANRAAYQALIAEPAKALVEAVRPEPSEPEAVSEAAPAE